MINVIDALIEARRAALSAGDAIEAATMQLAANERPRLNKLSELVVQLDQELQQQIALVAGRIVVGIDWGAPGGDRQVVMTVDSAPCEKCGTYIPIDHALQHYNKCTGPGQQTVPTDSEGSES
jgi:hypothetical protein